MISAEAVFATIILHALLSSAGVREVVDIILRKTALLTTAITSVFVCLYLFAVLVRCIFMLHFMRDKYIT